MTAMTGKTGQNGVLDRLGAHGQDYQDPLRRIDWAEADPALPWLPPELLSTASMAGGMNGDTERRVSQMEFARLCAAGMWLEGLMISRVTADGFIGLAADEARVMLQEVREESGHSLMFLEMIERAGADGVGLLGPTGLLTWVARRLKPKSPEFWAMVFVGETVTDTFATKALKRIREGRAQICPVARQVLDLHHRDEARHIAAARVFLGNRVAKMTPIRRALFERTLRFLLGRFLEATLYPTAASLKAAGVDNAEAVARAVRACPDRRTLANECARPALDLLARDGMLQSGSVNTKGARP